MRGFLILLSILLALLGIGFSAIEAHADPSSYIEELRAHGWVADDGDTALLRTGLTVCALLAKPGVREADVINNLWRHTDGAVGYADAAEFVRIAERHLCFNTPGGQIA